LNVCAATRYPYIRYPFHVCYSYTYVVDSVVAIHVLCRHYLRYGPLQRRLPPGLPTFLRRIDVAPYLILVLPRSRVLVVFWVGVRRFVRYRTLPAARLRYTRLVVAVPTIASLHPHLPVLPRWITVVRWWFLGDHDLTARVYTVPHRCIVGLRHTTVPLLPPAFTVVTIMTLPLPVVVLLFAPRSVVTPAHHVTVHAYGLFRSGYVLITAAYRLAL